MDTKQLELLKTLISFFSIAFAIWKYRQERRTKKLIALEAVELHKNVGLALGAIQNAKDAIIDGQSPSFEIGRAEGVCNAVLFESAKLYCNLKDTKIDDIDDLITSKQLEEKYKEIYYSFSDPQRGFFSMMIKRMKKIL